jgi:hypothetical protein
MGQMAEAPAEAVSTANTALQAIQERKWDLFISLVHPESLREFRMRHLLFFVLTVRRYHAGELEEPQLTWARTFAPSITENDVQRMAPEVMLAHYLEALGQDWPYSERRITAAHPRSAEVVDVTYESVVSRHGLTKVLPPELTVVRRTSAGWRIELTEGLIEQGSIVWTRDLGS